MSSTIWLEQKVYELCNEDGSPTQFKDGKNLLVSVNGNNTEIPISDLFVGGKCTFYPEEAMFKGHSLLYKLDKEEINISLVDSTNGYKYIIKKFRNPAIQASDKEISDIDFRKAIEDLKDIIALSPAREEQPVAEVTEDGMTSETKAGAGLNFTEEFSENKEYNEEVESLKKEGYSELREGNFSIISKEGEEPVIVRITPDTFFPVKNNKLEDGTTVEIVEGHLKVVFPNYGVEVQKSQNTVKKDEEVTNK